MDGSNGVSISYSSFVPSRRSAKSRLIIGGCLSNPKMAALRAACKICDSLNLCAAHKKCASEFAELETTIYASLLHATA